MKLIRKTAVLSCAAAIALTGIGLAANPASAAPDAPTSAQVAPRSFSFNVDSFTGFDQSAKRATATLHENQNGKYFTFTGTAAPGSTVRVQTGSTFTGPGTPQQFSSGTVVDENGRWSINVYAAHLANTDTGDYRLQIANRAQGGFWWNSWSGNDGDIKLSSDAGEDLVSATDRPEFDITSFTGFDKYNLRAWNPLIGGRIFAFSGTGTPGTTFTVESLAPNPAGQFGKVWTSTVQEDGTWTLNLPASDFKNEARNMYQLRFSYSAPGDDWSTPWGGTLGNLMLWAS